jgi:broad specificity phosphatase PhoE
MIYLIRHGEPAGAYGAHPNPGLTELGRRQAFAAAETLAKAGAKRAITSPWPAAGRRRRSSKS